MALDFPRRIVEVANNGSPRLWCFSLLMFGFRLTSVSETPDVLASGGINNDALVVGFSEFILCETFPLPPPPPTVTDDDVLSKLAPPPVNNVGRDDTDC